MGPSGIALLADRGVVSVTGVDAASFLDNLISNDLALATAPGAALHAGLLSPQGKILFEFFVVRTTAGFLLETALDQTAALAKRLTLYKLRAKVDIKDAAGEVVVAVLLGAVRARPGGVIAFVDPRHEQLGDRLLIPAPLVGDALAQSGALRMTADAYHAHRITLGVPAAGLDYQLGDAFPHEADFDLLHGVSFTKGCFVGQEVVARMQNKTVVRKRVVRVTGADTLASGSEIKVGEAVIGTLGSVAGRQGLAMLRLDRVVEALDKGQAIDCAGKALTVDAEAVRVYRDAVANRPVIDL
ncbi:MAG: YgfZ/GcvT domain-containing protein [Hyphomicrobiaceae bacterium]